MSKFRTRSGGTTPKPVVTFQITPTAWDALSTAGGTTPKQVVTHYGDHSDCREALSVVLMPRYNQWSDA